MIKGAIFDIDDTLYSHKIKDVPTLTLRALDELKQKGIKIGVCTSRIIAEMQTVPQILKDRVDCFILSTGAITLRQDNYYKAYTLKKEEVIDYINYFKANSIPYDYTDESGDLFYYGDEKLIKEYNLLAWAKNFMIKEYEGEEITNLFFWANDEKQAEDIRKIRENNYISWWGNCGNISPNLVDKSFGLLKFCQQYGFTTDEVIAFGDGGNDDVMLEMAGIGVAVKNSKENTKKAADYVCKKSIEDGGIYEALIDLNILEEKHYDPKIFFFDIDSTTFDHSIKDVREKTYEALQKLKDKGCKLCINTSRAYEEMYNVPKKLVDMMDCIIMLSGSYIIKDGKTYVKYMDDDQIKSCIQFLDNNDITYRYSLDSGHGYLNRHDEDKENLFATLYHMTPGIKKYEGERIIQILFYASDKRREELKKIMNKSTYSHLFLGGEFNPENTDKGFSLESVAKMYGFNIEDTCAFGDGDNDYTMLKKANLGIAMGNGTPQCKQCADYITDDISDEGLYNALIHFNILEE